MIVRGRDFAEIYDLVGIRVLVDTVRDCYAALGTIHARWNPVPGRFKDYIAMPKFNMYQSLHTTVIGPEGKPVELQIRTFDMHRRAEYGIAAHWKYKEDPGRPPRRRQPAAGQTTVNDMAWLRQLLDWQKETEDPGEFLESLRFDLVAERGLRLHAQGRRHRAAGRRDAGRLRLRRAHRGRPPHHRRPGQRPAGAAGDHPGQRRPGRGLHLQGRRRRARSRDWLTLRQEPAGPQQDPAWFSKERREEAIEQGKDAIARAMRKQNLPIQRLADRRLPDRRSRTRCATRHLRALRGDRRGPRLARRRVVQKLVAVARRRGGRHRGHRRGHDADPRRPQRAAPSADPGVVVKGVERRLGQAGPLLHAGARRPDHRLRHPRQRRLGAPRRLRQRRRRWPAQPERMLEVEWAPTASSVFLVAIQVEALDRSRLLSDVTRVLSDQHVNILSAVGHDHPRPGGHLAASPSRWATPSTSATSSRPSAASRASTTSTG